MKSNMGTVDRVVRALIALVVAGLIATGTVSGVLAIVLGVLAAVFVLTSMIGTCPLYLPFGISTRPRQS
jgi:K+-transporting ATPase A subunit